MLRYVLTVEGMVCGMCEAHICDVIRKTVPGAKKVSAARRHATRRLSSRTPPLIPGS